MTRLNQSRRGLIGYTYSPQVCNDVAVSTGSRQMSIVQEQAFEQGMAGDGRLRDIVRGILSKRHLITKHGPAVIDAVVKGIQFMNTDEGKQLKQDFKTIAPNQSERINNIVNKYTPPEQYQNAAAGIYKGVKAVQGQGLGVAGGGLGLAGAGLGLAGAGDTLPGDMLKKKLLQKMVREKRMKSLGDRTKTSPVVAGFNGGSIPTRRGGQSKSKGLGKGYKLNPRPLVGAGIDSQMIIKGLQKMVIPMLKTNKLVSQTLDNTEKIKQLIALKAKTIMKSTQDPQQIIMKVLESLKPIMKNGLKGSGVATILNNIAIKILAGIFRLGNPDSIIAKGIDKLKPRHQGGFIFSLAAIIAGISAAASAAAATTVVGTVTVGALAGAALTGAAGAAGAAIVNKIAGGSVKAIVLKAIKETKLTINDLPTKDKIKLKAGFESLKKNPTKVGIVSLGKKMAPIAREVMKKKLAKKIDGMSGSGLGLAGGSQAKKFDNNFVKHFTKTLTT
tara:strand:+ start:7944 stop:9446 length:1503 start_codon:yes stop_codon:yes gene_type:complete